MTPHSGTLIKKEISWDLWFTVLYRRHESQFCLYSFIVVMFDIFYHSLCYSLSRTFEFWVSIESFDFGEAWNDSIGALSAGVPLRDILMVMLFFLSNACMPSMYILNPDPFALCMGELVLEVDEECLIQIQYLEHSQLYKL